MSFTNRAQPHLARENSGWDCAYAINPNQVRCGTASFSLGDRPSNLSFSDRYMRVDLVDRNSKIVRNAGQFNEMSGQIYNALSAGPKRWAARDFGAGKWTNLIKKS
jgi:hypothetical protein